MRKLKCYNKKFNRMIEFIAICQQANRWLTFQADDIIIIIIFLFIKEFFQ